MRRGHQNNMIYKMDIFRDKNSFGAEIHNFIAQQAGKSTNQTDIKEFHLVESSNSENQPNIVFMF